MTEALIKRLREKRMRVHDLSGVGFEKDPVCEEAADTLEALMAALCEIERLGSDGEHSGDRHARCRELARTALAQARKE